MNLSNPLEHVDNQSEALTVRISKLEKINAALINRVEKSMDFSGGGFPLFQTAVVLEAQVRERTKDLEDTLEKLSSAYTQLRKATNEAREVRQNLSAAIEAIEEGFALFDGNEKLIMCNDPFARLMPDISKQLVAGAPFETMAGLFANSRYIIFEKGVSAEQWKQFRIRKFRAPYASFIQQFRDDRWLQVSNKKTSTGATVVFQTDISDLVRQERDRRKQQLDNNSQLLQAMIDQLPQGLCMFSDDAKLTTWNDQFVKLLNLPVKNVKQFSSFDKIWQDIDRYTLSGSPKTSQAILAWIKKGDQQLFAGVEVECIDGSFLWINCTHMPDGSLVIYFDDISAQKRATQIMHQAKNQLEDRVAEKTTELLIAKQKAEEANQSKTRFFAAASHDLLQPLDAARVFLSLLNDTNLDEKQRHFAKMANGAFGSMESLLDSLLDISRYDGGTVKPNYETFFIEDMFESLCDECMSSVQKKTNLKLRHVPSSLKLYSDVRLLRRILQNYATNAIRYTERGKVLVGIRRRNNLAEIQVLDTGVGIPSEQFDQIFLEFNRLRTTEIDLQSEAKAMGLGLAIVSWIARILQYKIEVKSIVGRGSCFSVFVPIASE